MRGRWPFTAWHFSKRLRAWIAGAPAGPLPSDVYAVLVNDCYSVLLSFGIGAIGGVLVGSMAAWRTGSVLLLILTVLAAAVAVGRVLLTISYRKAQPVADAAALKIWEWRYAIGASAYGACLGGLCFVAFAFIDDPVSHLILNSNAVGFAAGTTARNSSRPRIAVTQVSFIRVANHHRLCISLYPAVLGPVAAHVPVQPERPSKLRNIWAASPAPAACDPGKGRTCPHARRTKLSFRRGARQHVAWAVHARCRAAAVGLEQAVLRNLADRAGGAVARQLRGSDGRAQRPAAIIQIRMVAEIRLN